MISLKKKKVVFILWFIKGKGKREISRIAEISRGSVNKIINECQARIKELNLESTPELLEHIDSIVLASEKTPRKPYKLNKESLILIEQLFRKYEHKRKLYAEDAGTIKDLYYEGYLKSEDPNIVKDITIDSFYKYVRKIRNNIYGN